MSMAEIDERRRVVTTVATDDGVALQVFDCGAPHHPAVLIINAYGMPFEAVEPLVIEAQTHGFRAITWDCRILPGDGDPAHHRCRLSEHVADAASVLRHCRIESLAFAIGWCTGAHILLHLAALSPMPIGQLVLFNGSFWFPGVPRSNYQTQLDEALRRVAGNRGLANIFCRVLQQSAGGGLAEQRSAELRDIVSHPFQDGDRLVRYAALCNAETAEITDDREVIRRLQMPMRLLVGEHDPITPPEASRLLAEAAPNARFQLVTGADHYLPYTHPRLAMEPLSRESFERARAEDVAT